MPAVDLEPAATLTGNDSDSDVEYDMCIVRARTAGRPSHAVEQRLNAPASELVEQIAASAPDWATRPLAFADRSADALQGSSLVLEFACGHAAAGLRRTLKESPLYEVPGAVHP